MKRHLTTVVRPVALASGAMVDEPEATTLSAELVQDLGRILGEALVTQFRREHGPLVETCTGSNQGENEVLK